MKRNTFKDFFDDLEEQIKLAGLDNDYKIHLNHSRWKVTGIFLSDEKLISTEEGELKVVNSAEKQTRLLEILNYIIDDNSLEFEIRMNMIFVICEYLTAIIKCFFRYSNEEISYMARICYGRDAYKRIEKYQEVFNNPDKFREIIRKIKEKEEHILPK